MYENGKESKTLFSVRIPTKDYSTFCYNRGKELLGMFIRKCVKRAGLESAFFETVFLDKPMLSVDNEQR